MPPCQWTRRGYLTTIGVGGLLSGCLAPTEFDPDVEPIQRLGAADQISMDISPEADFSGAESASFEEWATRRATELATRRLQSRLDAAELTGEGVSIEQATVRLDDLDHPQDTSPPPESEFRRAVEIGPRVFHFHHYSRDGELLTEPAVAFGALVEETPRSFEVTVRDAGEQYVAVLPALCQRGWIRDE